MRQKSKINLLSIYIIDYGFVLILYISLLWQLVISIFSFYTNTVHHLSFSATSSRLSTWEMAEVTLKKAHSNCVGFSSMKAWNSRGKKPSPWHCNQIFRLPSTHCCTPAKKWMAIKKWRSFCLWIYIFQDTTYHLSEFHNAINTSWSQRLHQHNGSRASKTHCYSGSINSVSRRLLNFTFFYFFIFMY